MTSDDRTAALTDPRITLVGLLLESIRAIEQRLAGIHAGRGVRGSEFNFLLRLSRSDDGTLRITDLAAQTGVSTSGATSVVDRLEARGLVERSLDPRDRRSFLVTVTAAGRDLVLADIGDQLPMIEADVVAPLGDHLDRFTADLERLRDQLAPRARQDTTKRG